jgi:hypothetical protein
MLTRGESVISITGYILVAAAVLVISQNKVRWYDARYKHGKRVSVCVIIIPC